MDPSIEQQLRINALNKAVAATVSKLTGKGLTIQEPVFNVTMEEWKKLQDSWKIKIKQPEYAESYHEEEKKQLQREEFFLEKHNSCGGEKFFTMNDVQSRLNDVDMNRFGKMLTSDFFDDTTMNGMVCLSSSAFLTTSSSLAPNERIKTWVRNLRRIGEDSVSGYALLGDAGYGNGDSETAKSPFIVKAVRDTRKSSELTHEAFIGLVATNHLRKFIPNFAYIYGSFKCSPPLAGPLTDQDQQGKKIATFCNTQGKGNDTVQVVYENIAPARSFQDGIKDWDGATFMRNYLAILLALHKASELYEFTHYDLHSENVLLRKCLDTRYLEATKDKKKKNKFLYVPYNLRRSDGRMIKYYVVSDGEIPVIIDYGRCYVKIKGQSYGMPNSINFNADNTFRDRANPMYDAFKLLGFSLTSCIYSENYTLLAEIAPLFRYFNTEQNVVNTLLKLREDSYYELPYPSDIRDLETYIDYIISYSDLMGYNDVVTIMPPVGSFILVPVSEQLQVSVLEKVGLNKKTSTEVAVPRPRTILEAYDVMSKQYQAFDYFEQKYREARDGLIKSNMASQMKIALRTYRTIRDRFIQSSESGISDLDNALIYEHKRLSDIVYDFFMGVVDIKKAANMRKSFMARENIVSSINKKSFAITFSGNAKLFFTESALITSKNYIARIALFAEMRQSFMISLRGLNYMITGYTIVVKEHPEYQASINKIRNLFDYLFVLVDGMEPIYQEYKRTINSFIELFKGKRQQLMRDADSEYLWYFNTVTTLPSLLLEWPELRQKLVNKN